MEKEDRKITKKFNGSVKTLLKQLKILPETVIVVRDDELISEDTVLSEKDKIKILSVISGG